jgi:hypothetical protein
MAIVEDITAIVSIIVIILVIFFISTTYLVQKETNEITEQQEIFLEDYYATVIDTFLATKSESTNVPFNILIGDVINRAKTESNPAQFQFLREEINKTLSNLIREEHFYVEITPLITNITISFIIDGSNSLNFERRRLNETIDDIINQINNHFFPDGTAGVSYNVYLPHNIETNDQMSLCNLYFDGKDWCKIVLEDDIYDSTGIVTRPNFGFTNYNDWKNSDSHIAKTNEEIAYFEGEWAGTIYYAQKELNKSPEAKNTYHVIIPFSDELSTSSISDYCFNIPNTTTPHANPRINYQICKICDERCPVERSNRSFNNILDYIDNTGITTIIIPFMSDPCTFSTAFSTGSIDEYNTSRLNDSIRTLYTLPNNLVPNTTGDYYCNLTSTNCTGCSCPGNNCVQGDICFKTQCMNDLEEQMRFLASKTGGEFVNDSDYDPSTFHEKIIDVIQNALDGVRIRVGNLDTVGERTRFSYNKLITLPDEDKSQFNFFVVVGDVQFTLDDSSIIPPTNSKIIIYNHRPPNNSILTPRNNVSLEIRTNFNATCKFINDTIPSDFNDSNLIQMEYNFSNNNHFHKFVFDVNNGTNYSIYYICNSTSSNINISDLFLINFSILPDTCENNNYKLCGTCNENKATYSHLDGTNYVCCEECSICGINKLCNVSEQFCNISWTNPGNFCCLGNCLNCTDEGYDICPTHHGCKESNWADPIGPLLISCCKERCSNCSNEGHSICNSDEKCNSTITKWDYGNNTIENCCEGTCKNCTEWGPDHNICDPTKVCNGTLVEGFNRCCDGQCKDCDEIGYTCDSGKTCNSTWIDIGLRCCQEECVDLSVQDSICNSYWPEASINITDYEGFGIYINEWNPSCGLFDVQHPDLIPIIEQVENCCLDPTSQNCSTSYANQARDFAGISGTPTQEQLKKCMGRYIIYGLGPAKLYAQKYFYQEGCCGSISNMCGTKKSRTCSSDKNDPPFGGGAPVSDLGDTLLCNLDASNPNDPNDPNHGLLPNPPLFPKSWNNNTDWTKNSCYFSDLPASVSLLVLKTGQCVDYSVMATTLLRLAGYNSTEVYTLLGPRHAFNLIKFPGDTRYIIFDTTGNSVRFDVGGQSYSAGPYCSYIINPSVANPDIKDYICTNDNGKATCPDRSLVKGCE